MADLPRLVANTREKKRTSDQSVGWPLAAMMAVRASGVTNKADVKRLKERIVAELRRCGDIPSKRLSSFTKRSARIKREGWR